MQNLIKPPQFDLLKTYKSWLQLLAINTLIATILSVLGGNFLINFAFSQSIGICIASSIAIITNLLKKSEPTIFIYIFGIVIGGITGSTIVYIFLDGAFTNKSFSIETLMQSLFLAVIFGFLVSYYFYSIFQKKQQQIEFKNQLQQAQLQMLQAQIEPHFLFNTLATITSLIDKNPQNAKQLLNHIIAYLRLSLDQSRNQKNIKIKDEIKLTDLYLKIQKMRLGDRLKYQINIEKNCQQFLLPPLLLQPLVENAIIHGIEPAINGGLIQINISQKNQKIYITITDNGAGLKNNKTTKKSFALSNIKKRLRSIYQKDATFSIKNHKTQGAIATIILPSSRY
ncbi:MAG: hypothetical protein DRQ51_10245 [Gammaproteobacteria bacterium]|nr:MAG: hypothetical protein DRQ51_10245 [Gammaproteobacteria bacterium]